MNYKSDKYADIINLPHHTSPTRPRMSMYDRAAQFSPFAALTGYGAKIRETERVTEARAELSEDVLNELDDKLCRLAANLALRQQVSVTYFVPDERKSGGAYVTHCGVVRKIDSVARQLIFEDGEIVPIGEISAIEIQV